MDQEQNTVQDTTLPFKRGWGVGVAKLGDRRVLTIRIENAELILGAEGSWQLIAAFVAAAATAFPDESFALRDQLIAIAKGISDKACDSLKKED